MTWHHFLRQATVMFVCLGSGTVIGMALIAFFTALGVITRLTEVSRTYRREALYGWCVLGGAVLGSIMAQSQVSLRAPAPLTAFLGLFMGIFVGMIAAALTEVISVMPVVGRRLELGTYIKWLVIVFALGKTTGSIIYWLLGVFP